MARKPAVPRLFIPLEVDFDQDGDVAKLNRYAKPGEARACRDLLVAMWRYCKRTLSDGHVPAEVIGILAYPDTPKLGQRDADRLVACDLAERTETGYYLPGYLKRNPSREEVEAESARKSKAGHAGGKASGESRRASKDEAGCLTGSKATRSESLNTETETETESVPESQTPSTQESRQRPVTLDPADARCTAHEGIDDPGPCRGCMVARQAAEQHQTNAKTEQLRRRLDCRHCDDNGMVLDADLRPIRRCTHPHLSPVRNTA